MGMCSDPPPPPDLQAQADAMMQYSADMKLIADDQLAWSKEQYASNRQLLNRVLDTQLPIMEQNAQNAQEDRAFYESVYRPLEQNLVEDFKNYDTQDRREKEAGEATADVTTAFDAQRENASRSLESYGIDPSQVRSRAIDSEMRIQQAASQAGAANNARRRVEATGRALRGEALNIGRGYASNVAGAYNTAVNAGNSAVAGANSTTATGSNANANAINTYGQVGSGITSSAGIVNQGYQNQLAQFDSSNLITTSLAGGAGGYAASKIAEGGQVVGPGTGTSDSIPTAIGPPGVSAPANLSDGEYVVPADVVKWKGLEFFEKQIQNSKKAISERTLETPNGGVTGVVPPRTALPPGG